MVFLLAVVFSATLFGIWPALLSSVVSFLAYNFFFIEPHYTLSVSQPHELLALLIFLVIAVLTATLAECFDGVPARSGVLRNPVWYLASAPQFSGVFLGL